jgi:hypothetical protein
MRIASMFSTLAAALLTQQVPTQTPCYGPGLCPEAKFIMIVIPAQQWTAGCQYNKEKLPMQHTPGQQKTLRGSALAERGPRKHHDDAGNSA